MINYNSVVGMTRISKERVVTAPLGSDIFQEIIGRAVIDPGINAKCLRMCFFIADVISSRSRQAGEVQSCSRCHTPHRSVIQGSLTLKHDFVSKGVANCEIRSSPRVLRDIYGNLDCVREITKLVYSDPRLCTSRPEHNAKKRY